MKRLFYLSMFLFLLFLIGCGSPEPEKESSTTENDASESDEVYELKLGHVGAPDHHYHTIAEMYAELVNERTDGNVQISVFPADQLGTQLDSVEGVMLGTQDMVLTSETVLSNWIPNMGILNLPFIFRDLDHIKEVLEGEVGDALAEEVEEHGAKLVAWWAGGFRHITNNVRPIHTPEDLQDIKIRVPEGSVFIDTFEEIGAQPTVIAISELYSAMQLGTVDAQENPPAHILTQKFYEVQDYVSRTNHIYLGSPLIMNKELFESLPQEYQDVIIDTGRELFETHIELVKELEEEQWEEIESHGVEIIDPDIEPFIQATKPVIDIYREHLDEDLIDKIIESQ